MKLKDIFRKKTDPEEKAAYEKALREARIERAKREGRKAGLTKPKSVFEKLGSFGEAVVKDLGGGKGDFGSGLFGEPQRKRRKSKKKRRKK